MMLLSSEYAGRTLQSPVVIGSSPLALDEQMVKDLSNHEVGAIVMPSIFEEQITQDRFGFPSHDPTGSETEPRLPRQGPDWDAYNGGTRAYLETIERIRQSCSIPIIASINCISDEGWSDYVNRLESVGTDAIELTLFHYEVDPNRFADEIEQELLDRVQYVCQATQLPIAVKLVPNFTCLANVAFRIAGAGAKSVCLFGQAPVLESVHGEPLECHWRLTNHADLRVALEAVHQVRQAVPKLTIAASGGIRDADDAIAAIQLGANVVTLTSAIYRDGVSIIDSICNRVRDELQRHEMCGLDELIGSKCSGYDAFPKRTRREQYVSDVTATRPTEQHHQSIGSE